MSAQGSWRCGSPPKEAINASMPAIRGITSAIKTTSGRSGPHSLTALAAIVGFTDLRQAILDRHKRGEFTAHHGMIINN